MRLYDFLKNTASILDFLAKIVLHLHFGQQYYVYVPTRDKPKFIHTSYLSAITEAKRLRKIINFDENVVILQIITKIEAEIPF